MADLYSLHTACTKVGLRCGLKLHGKRNSVVWDTIRQAWRRGRRVVVVVAVVVDIVVVDVVVVDVVVIDVVVVDVLVVDVLVVDVVVVGVVVVVDVVYSWQVGT